MDFEVLLFLSVLISIRLFSTQKFIFCLIDTKIAFA